ncbi:MAG TPA: hypothetical protein VEX86_02645 [Longimicrobium sp.]|nr:hypothetical protein [Longimicrobium sp.]
MPITLMVHIAAGGLGIVAGFAALYAAKGAGLHRRSGVVFVYAMVTMGILGSAIAAWGGGEISVIAGLLTAYLVTTGLTTVRPPTEGTRRLDFGAMVLALSIGVTSFALSLASLARGETARDGVPIGSLLVFGTVALLAGLFDVRVIRSGGVRGPARLARHLWRMCFALWIASASFFLGQADKIPEALRIPGLLAVPVLAPLVAMLYWLWRVRVRKSFRRPLPVAAPEPI